MIGRLRTRGRPDPMAQSALKTISIQESAFSISSRPQKSAFNNQHSAFLLSLLGPPVEPLEVADVELEVGFTLEFVFLEGEREVDAGAIAIEELGALGGAPGDRAKAPALLAEGHLEVALLQRARPIDDLDTRGVEH